MFFFVPLRFFNPVILSGARRQPSTVEGPLISPSTTGTERHSRRIDNPRSSLCLCGGLFLFPLRQCFFSRPLSTCHPERSEAAAEHSRRTPHFSIQPPAL